MNTFPAAHAATLCLAFTMACAPAMAAGRPRLTAVTPDSVHLIEGNVTELDLRGFGFDTTSAAPGNTVWIGALELRGVPSRGGGTALRVAIPSAIASAGEAPPRPWMGGRYPIWVSTRTGASDTLSVAITSVGRLP